MCVCGELKAAPAPSVILEIENRCFKPNRVFKWFLYLNWPKLCWPGEMFKIKRRGRLKDAVKLHSGMQEPLWWVPLLCYGPRCVAVPCCRLSALLAADWSWTRSRNRRQPAAASRFHDNAPRPGVGSLFPWHRVALLLELFDFPYNLASINSALFFFPAQLIC